MLIEDGNDEEDGHGPATQDASNLKEWRPARGLSSGANEFIIAEHVVWTSNVGNHDALAQAVAGRIARNFRIWTGAVTTYSDQVVLVSR